MADVLLLGAAGQLGHDLQLVWPELRPDDRLLPSSHDEVDVTDPDSVRRAVSGTRLSLIINAAAYVKVDQAETEPELAYLVNETGARNVAQAAAAAGAAVVLISTDYVFSGAGRSRRQPYQEDDPVDPLNVYGASKAAGERAVRETNQRHFIVRSCGLYGVAGSSGKGGNFVRTMLRKAAAGEAIRVVDDQILTPTHTLGLARQLAVLTSADAYGTYHATCQGECSWFEFAAEIFAQTDLKADLRPQASAEAGYPARRPSYSVLDNRNLRGLGSDRMPDWRDALREYFEVSARP